MASTSFHGARGSAPTAGGSNGLVERGVEDCGGVVGQERVRPVIRRAAKALLEVVDRARGARPRVGVDERYAGEDSRAVGAGCGDAGGVLRDAVATQERGRRAGRKQGPHLGPDLATARTRIPAVVDGLGAGGRGAAQKG